MDRKLPQNPEIERLIRLSQTSRTYFETEAVLLRQRLDIPSRIRGSLNEHPSAWLFGSIASGLVASTIFRRRPALQKKRRGFSGALIGLTLTAARPLAKVWLTGELKHLAAGSFENHAVPLRSPNSKSS
jgi:hypothetical protein